MADSYYKQMLENIYEGIYFVDLSRKITFWNKGAERITGFSAEEVMGKFCFNNILNHVTSEGKKLCYGGCPLHKTILDGTMRSNEIYLQHKEGHRVPVSVRTILLEEDGEKIGAVEMFTDQTEHVDILKNMEELKVVAMRDQLTQLPNRRYIDVYLESKLQELNNLGIPLALGFVDIDFFKNVNDTYGHAVGDDVLKMVAQTMLGGVRNTDIVGRYGGEEFLIAWPGIKEDYLEKVAENLRMLVENSGIRSNEEMIRVTISMGVTMAQNTDTVQTLIQRADQLVYQSKHNGRNRITLG